MDRDQGIKLMQDLLRRMVERKGSDLFITAGFAPAIKIDGEIKPQTPNPLTPEQSALLVRKAGDLMLRLGLKTRGDGHNSVSLQFPNGSRIVGLPGKERYLRGFSAVSLLVVDEASRVEDELYTSMRPMLAASDGDVWLMSTPAGKRGFFSQRPPGCCHRAAINVAAFQQTLCNQSVAACFIGVGSDKTTCRLEVAYQRGAFADRFNVVNREGDSRLAREC